MNIWPKKHKFLSVRFKNYIYMMTRKYVIDSCQIKNLFFIKYGSIIKKQSKTADFFLRFHNLKSGVSFSTGPVITKYGFWWFEKLTQVFIFHIKQIFVLYHTYFRFSAYLADPTPKYQQTGSRYLHQFKISLLSKSL